MEMATLSIPAPRFAPAGASPGARVLDTGRPLDAGRPVGRAALPPATEQTSHLLDPTGSLN